MKTRIGGFDVELNPGLLEELKQRAITAAMKADEAKRTWIHKAEEHLNNLIAARCGRYTSEKDPVSAIVSFDSGDKEVRVMGSSVCRWMQTGTVNYRLRLKSGRWSKTTKSCEAMLFINNLKPMEKKGKKE